MTAEERADLLESARETARRIWHGGASIERFAAAIAAAIADATLREKERIEGLLRAEAVTTEERAKRLWGYAQQQDRVDWVEETKTELEAIEAAAAQRERERIRAELRAEAERQQEWHRGDALRTFADNL